MTAPGALLCHHTTRKTCPRNVGAVSRRRRSDVISSLAPITRRSQARAVLDSKFAARACHTSPRACGGAALSARDPNGHRPAAARQAARKRGVSSNIVFYLAPRRRWRIASQARAARGRKHASRCRQQKLQDAPSRATRRAQSSHNATARAQWPAAATEAPEPPPPATAPTHIKPGRRARRRRRGLVRGPCRRHRASTCA